jgi:hypothetical protein
MNATKYNDVFQTNEPKKKKNLTYIQTASSVADLHITYPTITPSPQQKKLLLADSKNTPTVSNPNNYNNNSSNPYHHLLGYANTYIHTIKLFLILASLYFLLMVCRSRVTMVCHSPVTMVCRSPVPLETTTATKIFLISFFVNATRSFLQKEEKG